MHAYHGHLHLHFPSSSLTCFISGAVALLPAGVGRKGGTGGTILQLKAKSPNPCKSTFKGPELGGKLLVLSLAINLLAHEANCPPVVEAIKTQHIDSPQRAWTQDDPLGGVQATCDASAH